MAADNKSLGKFQLTGIPAARRGIPQIEVTFDIDANGIVNVSARDKATGKEQSITISGSTALSDSEIDRMVKDAEAHAEDDRRKKDDMEVRNRVDALSYSVEQTVKELGDKIPSDIRSEADRQIEKAKTALDGSDIDAIRECESGLTDIAHKVSEIAYSSANGSQGGADDGAEEAEYEVDE